MADLFSITAPMLVRRGDGVRHIIAERFPLVNSSGLVYFEVYWHLHRPATEAIHVLNGEILGDGPWRIANNVVSILGCQGSDPELATAFAEWQQYLQLGAPGYPGREAVCMLARSIGAYAE